MNHLFFVPVSIYDGARALRAGRDLAYHLLGCAATDSLIAALGPGSSPEEAGYAALSNAGKYSRPVLPLDGRGSYWPPR